MDRELRCSTPSALSQSNTAFFECELLSTIISLDESLPASLGCSESPINYSTDESLLNTTFCPSFEECESDNVLDAYFSSDDDSIGEPQIDDNQPMDILNPAGALQSQS